MASSSLLTPFYRFWNDHGWHILLILLLFVFLILFVINQCSMRSSDASSVSFRDIYEYFLGMILAPTYRSSSHRHTSSHQRQSPSQNMSRGELACKQFAEFYFQCRFDKIRPDFLKNPVTGENLELDLFNDELQLAIEYNGIQHYQYNAFMHKDSRDRFQNQQYRDMIKKDLCHKAGIRLITVPYSLPHEEIAPFLLEAFQQLALPPHPDSHP